MRIITEMQMQQIAPSVFAADHSDNLSDKYIRVPTIDSVRALADIGFFPVDVRETRVRSAEKKDYTKHCIRFRQVNAQQVAGVSPEMILVNSHDGTAAYQLRCGIYRFACANGLVVGNDLFAMKVRHQGDVLNRIVEGAQRIRETFPKALEICDEWSRKELTFDQQFAYAKAALALKYDEDCPIDPEKLMIIRRHADIGNDVFTTFNRVQENLIRGGIGYGARNRRRRTREVGSINEILRLNKALWMLTEHLAAAV